MCVCVGEVSVCLCGGGECVLVCRRGECVSACGNLRRFSAGAVNNLQIGGALTRIIYSGILLTKF